MKAFFAAFAIVVCSGTVSAATQYDYDYFVKGYVRALDDNLLISEAESVAIRNELKRWPETLLAE